MNNIVSSLDKQEISMIKQIGARLKQARELTNLGLHQASKLINVPVDTLKSLEDGVDVRPIPLWIIQRAAQVYDISVDFLFGLSSDWEICLEVRRERDFVSHLQNILIEEQAKVTAKLIQQDNQIATLADTVTALAPAIKNIYNTILCFWEVNPEFEDMKCGASVIYALDRADEYAHSAICQLVKSGLLGLEALKSYQIQEPKNKGFKNK